MAHPLPPIPPPRAQPLVDLPVSPLYNNLSSTFENSSDSELEKMEAKLFVQSYTSTQKSHKSTFKKGMLFLFIVIRTYIFHTVIYFQVCEVECLP